MTDRDQDIYIFSAKKACEKYLLEYETEMKDFLNKFYDYYIDKKVPISLIDAIVMSTKRGEDNCLDKKIKKYYHNYKNYQKTKINLENNNVKILIKLKEKNERVDHEANERGSQNATANESGVQSTTDIKNIDSKYEIVDNLNIENK